MENKKKIDDLIKNELGNYTETPPPAVWSSLEQRLGHKPSPKPGIPWFGYFAMVVALIAISVIVVKNNSKNTNTATDNIAANNNISKGQNTDNNIAATTNSNTQTTTNNTPAGNEDKTATGNEQKAGNNSTNDRLATAPATNSTTNPTAGKATNRRAEATINETTRGKATVTKNKHSRHTTAGRYAAKTTRGTNGRALADVAIQQPENVYNSSIANTKAPTESKTTDDQPLASTQPNNSDTSLILKKKQVNAPPPQQRKPRPKYARFEAGVKGGYEQGGINDDAKKGLISPYLQYKITPKLAIMLQPAVKYAMVESRVIGAPRNYYNVNKDGSTTEHADTTPVHIIGTNQTVYLWNYTYTETHDSIVKTNATGGTYAEFEMPVLLKYYLAKDFSIYGGVNMVYSRLIGLTEHTYIAKSLLRTVSETAAGPSATVPPPPTEPLSIAYTGTPYSSYTGPQYPAPKGSMLRFGYMFGFSYEYEKKWLFDALIQQSFISPNVQAGFNTNTPLSAPYIRLTVGYKLISR